MEPITKSGHQDFFECPFCHYGAAYEGMGGGWFSCCGCERVWQGGSRNIRDYLPAGFQDVVMKTLNGVDGTTN